MANDPPTAHHRQSHRQRPTNCRYAISATDHQQQRRRQRPQYTFKELYFHNWGRAQTTIHVLKAALSHTQTTIHVLMILFS